MIQNNADEFRLDVNGLVQLTTNPWEGWVGMPQQSFPRYIETDEYSATGEQDGTVKVTAEPNSPTESSVDMVVDSTWRRRAKLPNPGFELEMDAKVAVPNMPVVSMDLRFHAAGQPHVPINGDRVTEIRLDDVTIHQRENLGGAHKPVQAVISRTGVPIRGTDASATDDNGDIPICGSDRACLDVRNLDNIASADWTAPDVMAGGATGTIMMQMAGVLQVYSNDHPDAGRHPLAAWAKWPL